MANKTVAIGDATPAELRYYAETVLGLDIHHFTRNPDTLRAKIATVVENLTEITVPDNLEDGPAPPVAAPRSDDQRADLRAPVILKIPQQDEPGGSEPVMVSVNGRAMAIPRDQWCEVSYPYFMVLQNAVEDHYEALENGGMSTTTRKIQRYPFQTWTGEADPPEGVTRPPAKAQNAGVAA